MPIHNVSEHERMFLISTYHLDDENLSLAAKGLFTQLLAAEEDDIDPLFYNLISNHTDLFTELVNRGYFEVKSSSINGNKSVIYSIVPDGNGGKTHEALDRRL